MGKAPAVQFYTGDFLTGTTLMSNAEVGLYIRLLCLQAEHGSVPDDVERIVQTYGAASRKLWKAVRSKFIPGKEAGTLVNERMCEVVAAREAFRERQAEKGRTSASLRANSGSTKDKPRTNPGSTVVEPLGDGDRSNTNSGKERARSVHEYTTEFEAAFKAYGSRGSKFPAFKVWGKLSEAEQAAVFTAIPAEVAGTPDAQYRRHFSTYLNERGWEDHPKTPPKDPREIVQTTGWNPRL